jgi:hypothetical protein
MVVLFLRAEVEFYRSLLPWVISRSGSVPVYKPDEK